MRFFKKNQNRNIQIACTMLCICHEVWQAYIEFILYTNSMLVAKRYYKICKKDFLKEYKHGHILTIL